MNEFDESGRQAHPPAEPCWQPQQGVQAAPGGPQPVPAAPPQPAGPQRPPAPASVCTWDKLPEVLRARPQWMPAGWNGKDVADGGGYKVPLSVGEHGRLYKADKTDPSEWMGFDYARRCATAQDAGLGFAISDKAPDPLLLAVDVDFKRCTSQEQAQALRDMAERAGTYAETSQSGKGLRLVFFVDGPPTVAQPGVIGPVELFWTQGYVVMTGRSLHELPRAVATIPAQHVDAMVAHFRTAYGGGAGTSANSGSGNDGLHVEQADAKTVTELRDALNMIPAQDREVWVKVGMALKTLGDVGRGLWFTWSQTCPEQWDPADAEHRWRTFKPRGDIRYTSVFHMAQERGWVNPASRVARQGHQQPPGAAQPAGPGVGQPAASQRPQAEPFTSISIADLFTRRAPRPAFLIQDYAPARQVTLMPADGGTGKSLLMLIAAVCMAIGRPFMGKTAVPCMVIYYSAEDDEDVLRYRLALICEHMGVDPAELGKRLCVKDATDNPCLFAEAYSPEDGHYVYFTDNLARIEATMLAMQAGNPAVRVCLVIDNASDVYDANENVRQQVRGFVRGLKVLAKQFHGAIILLAHLDKASARGNGGAAKYSGSTAWHNSVRSRLMLEPKMDGGEPVLDRLVLSQEKNNYGRKSAPVELEWTPDGMLELVRTGAEAAPRGTQLNDAELTDELLSLMAEYEGRIGTSFAAQSKTGPWPTLSADTRFPPQLKADERRGKAKLERLLRRAEQAERICKIKVDHPTRRGHKNEVWHVQPALLADGDASTPAPGE